MNKIIIPFQSIAEINKEPLLLVILSSFYKPCSPLPRQYKRVTQCPLLGAPQLATSTDNKKQAVGGWWATPGICLLWACAYPCQKPWGRP